MGRTQPKCWLIVGAALAGGWPFTAAAQGPPDIVWFGGGTGASMMAMSSDGQTLVTSARLNELALKVWRIDGTFVRTMGTAYSPYLAAAFSPDGQYVLAGREGVAGMTEANAEIWRVSDGRLVRGLNAGQTNNLNAVFAVAYSPSGSTAAIAYDTYRGIDLYDTATGALVRTLPDAGYAVTFSPDGQMIAGTTTSGPRLWRASDGSVLRTFTPGANLFSFSADSQYLAAGQGNFGGAVRIYRTDDGSLVRTINPLTVQYPRSVAFAPDQPLVVVAGSRDAAAPIGTLLSDEAIEEYRLDGSRVWAYQHEYGIAFSAGFTPDGQNLMIAGGWATPVPAYVEGGDDSIQRLRASDGVEMAHFAGRRGLAYGAAFSPDSQTFACAGSTMQIWRVADGAVLHTFDNGAVSVEFSRDGTMLVAAAGQIQIWSVPGYSLLRTLPGHLQGTNQAVISPDGSVIGSGGGDGNVKLWRVADGSLLWTRPINGTSVESVAISPDGQIIAGGCGGSAVRLWRVADGMVLRTIVGINAVDSIGFSPDGSAIAVAEQAYGNNLKLYRVSDGTLLHAFAGSEGFHHQSVTFTPDGATIVFSSGARFIQFWRVADGALLRTYDQETGTGYFPWMPVAVSPDSRFFGYGRQDAMVVMARNPFASGCYPNCDGSTGLPALNVNDFVCFQQRFAAGDTYADCDHGGTLNVDDFICFLGSFAAGCP